MVEVYHTVVYCGVMTVKTARKKSVKKSSAKERVCAVFSRSLYVTVYTVFVGAVLGGAVTIAAVRYTSFGSVIPLADGGMTAVHIEEEVDLSFRPADEMKPEELRDIDLTDFWEVWRLIESEYVPKPVRYSADARAGISADDAAPADDSMPADDSASRPNREELLYGAMDGLARSTGDIYTTFFSPKDTDRFREEVLEGEVDGIIGSYIHMKGGVLTVAKAFKNGPAYAAGLRTGDLILEVDGVKTALYNLDQAVDAIRGPRGTAVNLKVYRPASDDEFELSVVRDLVEIPSVETEVRDKVFIIRLLTFTKKTPAMFRRAMLEFARQVESGGPTRILLDMRGNSGGLLGVAVHIANIFLTENSVILYEYDGTEKLRAYRSGRSIFKTAARPKMTVLVDGGTASASEILAATLRFHGLADIVGTRTTGKGSVQSVKNIGNGSSVLKITTAHWLTPEKSIISENGITPDADYAEEVKEFLKRDDTADVEEYVLRKAVRHLGAK